jgi:hypothetical protein
MDNTIIPYEDADSDSSSDLDDSSSDDDEHSHLLSNNIGVHYNKFNGTNTAFMNMEDPKVYAEKRNRLFTPEITKRIFTVKLNASSTIFSLKEDIKLPTDNIIGFKILKSSFTQDANLSLLSDLSVPEIPEIACDKNDEGANIIARIPLSSTASVRYTHQYLELSLIDRYFFPINLDILTFNLSVNLPGFIVIELSYFNDQVKNT